MRYTVAILADIHGNADALEAVLNDLDAYSPDEVMLGGDLLMNGPKPAECIAKIRSLGVPGVVGNTDLYILDPSERIDPVAAWARQQLSDEDLVYLTQLPIQQRITPPNAISPDQDLLVVHSTPRDPDDLLILEVHPFGTSFTKATPIPQAEAMLLGAQAKLIVYGHIHYFSAGVVAGQRVASVGSVGCPFDHDHRAAYGLAVWDGERWTLEARRVSYDHEQVACDIEQSNIPYAASLARRIREADWVARG
jgi:protein phosphatase